MYSKIILSVVLLSSFIFSQYEYSLEDYNPTSPTYGSDVWYPDYSSYITIHFITTQGWAGWTSLFGQLSDFQDEMYEEGYDQMLIIGVGQSNLQNNFGSNFCANSDLPLVLDQLSEGYPIRDLLDGEHRELVFINNSGEIVGTVLLGSSSLSQYENQIRNLIINNYPSQTALGDLNEDGNINIQDIILIIGDILGTISLSETQLELADVNQDGTVDILDIVQVINLILTP